MILQPSEIHLAAQFLREGKLVAFPTETVYGLGACVFNSSAIASIFRVKGRPQDNPLIVHISDLHQLSLIAEEIPDDFYVLADAFFPGPLTILLHKKSCVPASVSANLPTIGVRMPAHLLARALIETVGEPLVAPSANLSGKPSSTTAQHVWDDFGHAIAAILDGGPCEYGLESTVVALTPNPLILRPGAISKQHLEDVLKQPVLLADGDMEKPLSPGMKYRHYAPEAKVRLFFSMDALDKHIQAFPHSKREIILDMQPAALYSLLREADSKGQAEILIYCNDTIIANAALMNRLTRAAGLTD